MFRQPPKKRKFVEETFNVEVFKGRPLKEGDIDKALLGYNYQFEDKVFKKPVKLGEKIKINGRPFEVIGFYEEIGNPQDDANVYLTQEGFEKIFGSTDFEYVYVRAAPGNDPTELAEKIKRP